MYTPHLDQITEDYVRGFHDGYDHRIDRTSSYSWGSKRSHDYADGYVDGHGMRGDDDARAENNRLLREVANDLGALARAERFRKSYNRNRGVR